MSRWAIYEDDFVLMVSSDESTDMCEIHRLSKNDRQYQGKITHSLCDEVEVVPYSALESPREEPDIVQYFDDLFVLNDGDEDYVPSDGDYSDSEISDVSVEDECPSAVESPERELDVQKTENTE